MSNQSADIDQVFEDYEDTVSDLLSSNYKTFDTNLARFFAMLDTVEPFRSIIESLPAVDFNTWYENAIDTVRGMVGSGTLDWPSESKEYLSMHIALLRHIDAGNEDVPNFCSKFMYSGNHFDTMIAEFGDQIVEPTARDIQKLAERSVPTQDSSYTAAHLSAPKEMPWYQRPLGIILLGLFITIVGGLAVGFLLVQ